MKFSIYILSFVVFISGCKKFVDIPPPATQLVRATVFTDDATAAAAVSGVFETLVFGPIGGGMYGTSIYLGLSADEFAMYPNANQEWNQLYTNSLSSTTAITLWTDIYKSIYQCNAAIEELSSSTKVTDSLRQQFIGQLKFVRALCYFNLVNIFGGVPLILSSDYQSNAIVPRNTETQVYGQMIMDLKDCVSILHDEYQNLNGSVSTERTLPNKFAAIALLSRVYLYLERWQEASAAASDVINRPDYQLATNVNTAFLKGSPEAICQLEAPNNGFNTADAAKFLYGVIYGPDFLPYGPFPLSDSLVNSLSADDFRRSWMAPVVSGTQTYYLPYKYKLSYTGSAPQEYAVILRLAEQYLIRAEAKAQQNDIDGALSDLNVIRNRANLADTSLATKETVLGAIYQERFKELFTENGHRWMDIKRTGLIDGVMSVAAPLKGGEWNPGKDNLYPIPLSEIKAAPQLVQNPGYE